MAKDCTSLHPSKGKINCSDSPPHHDFMSLLSEPTYDILSFHDVRSLSQEERIAVAKCMDKVLLAFLENIGFQFRPTQQDHELRRDLWAWGRSKFVKICDGNWSQAEQILELSVTIVEDFYPLSCPDSRLQLALVSAIALHAEKFAENASYAKGLASFTFDLLLQKKSSEDWYILYSDVMRDYIQHFGTNDPRIATFGAISLAQYIEIGFAEQRFSEKLPPHFSQAPPGNEVNRLGSSKGFPFFFRFLTGVPGLYVAGIMKPSKHEDVPYDYWITSVVNLITFINLGNDLYSWAKEVRDGDTINYMSFQTRSRQQAGRPSQFQGGGAWTFRDTLCETLKTMQTVTADLDREFVHFASTCTEAERSSWNTDLASRCWSGFKHGYISWHLQQSRYGLDRLQHSFRSGSEKGVL